MPSQFKNNHYVPEWYQNRFLPASQTNKELYYLHLKPEIFIDSKGIAHPTKGVFKQGFRKCFAQDDLYTLKLGPVESTEIEQKFFGDIDRNGQKAVEFFTNFTHSSPGHAHYAPMVLYMSTQKLRTPKGLDWLATQVDTGDWNQLLAFMVKLRNLHSAIWTECIWQITDASQSPTKFIISDHPVTVYNRVCGPRSQYCKEANDPDIRLHATQTIFPLSIDKLLILTNLSWVRNPYQSEVKFRPNPNPFRNSVFNFLDIQIGRQLSEQEVREINFIIKSRAYNYIAAAEEDWLFPEKYVSKSNWNKYGDGYLLMPDPRGVNAGGELYWGNNDGTTGGIDPYGRLPGDPDFSKESDEGIEFATLHKFKGEFATKFGPVRRGWNFDMGSFIKKDTDEMYKYHLSLFKKKKYPH
ncbi:hypothetical protein A3C59_04335 [Candidatus Daviesbacteria bacterium RIFCSPHIGHO2_02_FULL_36_13]|uniref:DUF4238 domain-containing protein n=1 Tax=Candidatus Daviesbacteria bacterium RIFCSPHIGHO2_02_FULL_36_13 TaxID=1797768 RepID=A0A1F5JW03_9BACT|nr:MAG: hypothetical protein A3C59_04335 [Candidatus Daviesbacteria bacterium RIFCSPHIGHO2_02_FULL_36_13]